MDLRFGRSLFDQRCQQGNGVRVQPQFGFIHEDDRWPKSLGLQEQRGQCDETKRAIRKGRCVEIGVGAFVSPFQSDLIRVQPLRLQLKVVEERSHALNRTPDEAVRGFVFLANVIEKRSEVGAIRANYDCRSHPPFSSLARWSWCRENDTAASDRGGAVRKSEFLKTRTH